MNDDPFIPPPNDEPPSSPAAAQPSGFPGPSEAVDPVNRDLQPTSASHPSAAPEAEDELEESEDWEERAAEELLDWKQAMRRDFEVWLDSINEIPEAAESEDDPAAPDLYAFYEQLAILNTESRKANRRTVEAFSQWSDLLGHFDRDLQSVREQLARLPSAQAGEESLSRPHCLVLVELLDRLHRLARAFQVTPARSWWGGQAAWRKTWETQRQAFAILVSHFEALMTQEGVTRIDTSGGAFDPALMTAVATETDAGRPPFSVIEEIAAGYRLRGELLRPAHVKVTIHPTNPIPAL